MMRIAYETVQAKALVIMRIEWLRLHLPETLD